MSNNKAFYEANAEQFFITTIGADMEALHNRFLEFIPDNGLILDAGCGSGRDAKAFLARGYQVEAFDASPSLAEMASEHLGQQVRVDEFQTFCSELRFDGIWACASLLHLPAPAIPPALLRLWASLRNGGVLYCSFKVGHAERFDRGRTFTDANEPKLCDWISHLPNVKEIRLWRTLDARPDRTDEWLNALVFRRY